jgi:hypothetical protein
MASEILKRAHGARRRLHHFRNGLGVSECRAPGDAQAARRLFACGKIVGNRCGNSGRITLIEPGYSRQQQRGVADGTGHRTDVGERRRCRDRIERHPAEMRLDAEQAAK